MSSPRQTGRVRWAFNIATWNCGDSTIEDGLALLNEPSECERIRRFFFRKDKCSALVGRLLLRRMIIKVLNVPYEDVTFSRTREGKPYLAYCEKHASYIRSRFPNFNFNVSHHGDWVILATEPELLVGADVMKIEVSGKNSIPEFFSLMSASYTAREWEQIRLDYEHIKQLEQFYRFWTLKEAFIKAVGIGLGFELLRMEFRQNIRKMNRTRDLSVVETDTQLYIDGIHRPNWMFQQYYLDDLHVVTCGLGPTEDAVQSFRHTLPSNWPVADVAQLPIAEDSSSVHEQTSTNTSDCSLSPASSLSQVSSSSECSRASSPSASLSSSANSPILETVEDSEESLSARYLPTLREPLFEVFNFEELM